MTQNNEGKKTSGQLRKKERKRTLLGTVISSKEKQKEMLATSVLYIKDLSMRSARVHPPARKDYIKSVCVFFSGPGRRRGARENRGDRKRYL